MVLDDPKGSNKDKDNSGYERDKDVLEFLER